MVQRLDVAHLGPCTHRKAGAQQAAQTAGQGSRDGNTVHPAHFLPLKDMAAQRQGACEDTGTRGTAHALFGAAVFAGDAGIGKSLSLPEAAAHVRAETFDDAVDVPPGFDDTYYPEGLETVPKRYAIVHADRALVRASQYLIASPGLGQSRELTQYALRRERQGKIQVTLLSPTPRQI